MVVASFEEARVRNMIGIVNWLSVFFFAHPKHHRKLEETIHSTQPELNVQKVKDLCGTRRVERIDALDRMKTLHPSIVACFESISAEGSRMWSPDSVTDAPASYHFQRIHQPSCGVYKIYQGPYY